jgi:hypothetical protein
MKEEMIHLEQQLFEARSRSQRTVGTSDTKMEQMRVIEIVSRVSTKKMEL